MAKKKDKKDLIQTFTLAFKLPPLQAKEFLEKQGFKFSANWQEQLEIIKAHCFTVAKIFQADVLEIIKTEIDKAMNEGLPLETFKKDLRPLLTEKGIINAPNQPAYRLDTIYRTNMQSAYQAGRYIKQKEIAIDFPYLEFITVLDVRTTSGCRALASVVLTQNDSFWAANYPPRHYNCRSRVRALNDRQLERYGLKVSDSKDYKDVLPAPGFESSPADAWKPDLNKYSDSIKKQVQKALAL